MQNQGLPPWGEWVAFIVLCGVGLLVVLHELHKWWVGRRPPSGAEHERDEDAERAEAESVDQGRAERYRGGW